MNIMRCLICDTHKERTPSGWCRECTTDFHRALRAMRAAGRPAAPRLPWREEYSVELSTRRH